MNTKTVKQLAAESLALVDAIEEREGGQTVNLLCHKKKRVGVVNGKRTGQAVCAPFGVLYIHT